MACTHSLAVAIRGEVWRWGCERLGQKTQLSIANAYVKNLLDPLEKRGGYCVEVFLTMDDRGGASGGGSHEPCHLRPGFNSTEAAYFAAFGKYLRNYHFVTTAHNQADSFRRTLEFYDQFSANHDALIVVRHDVELTLSVDEWQCIGSHKLGLGAPMDMSIESPGEPPLDPVHTPSCEDGVSDLVHYVPKKHYNAFAAMIGSTNGTSPNEEPHLPWPSCNEVCGCFSKRHCEPNDISGHACFAVAATLLPRSQIGFCWPKGGTVFSSWRPKNAAGKYFYAPPPLHGHDG